MATFNKHKFIAASPTLIPDMAQAIRREFQYDGFEVNIEDLINGGADISITKGGFFKAIVGMKSALKITLQPCENGVLFDANVGIFGQQVIPSIIAYLWCWPVLITQIWGMVEQSKLDDRAFEAAKSVCDQAPAPASPQQPSAFCPKCGKQVPPDAKFCPACGSPL
jgi:hypothetical protein